MAVLLLLARRLDQGFHVRQVSFKRRPAALAETVLGAGQAALEPFLAEDVAGFFELARVDAQIAVCSGQDLLEFGERETFIYRERADDAEPQTFMDDPVEGPGGGACGYDLRTVALCL